MLPAIPSKRKRSVFRPPLILQGGKSVPSVNGNTLATGAPDAVPPAQVSKRGRVHKVKATAATCRNVRNISSKTVASGKGPKGMSLPPCPPLGRHNDLFKIQQKPAASIAKVPAPPNSGVLSMLPSTRMRSNATNAPVDPTTQTACIAMGLGPPRGEKNAIGASSNFFGDAFSQIAQSDSSSSIVDHCLLPSETSSFFPPAPFSSPEHLLGSPLSSPPKELQQQQRVPQQQLNTLALPVTQAAQVPRSPQQQRRQNNKDQGQQQGYGMTLQQQQKNIASAATIVPPTLTHRPRVQPRIKPGLNLTVADAIRKYLLFAQFLR